MKIINLTETQKYELLLSVLHGKPMTFNDPVGHLVIDYMPDWDKFCKSIHSNLKHQGSMGGSWRCSDCIDLENHIEQINAMTHRVTDYNDPNEEDFTCNCSYCQIVLELDCNCGRCELDSNNKTFLYKDYVTGNEIEVPSYKQSSPILHQQNDTEPVTILDMYNEGLITKRELIQYTRYQ